jgi:pimeloyl-ACP methyl ester carboxylesterase
VHYPWLPTGLLLRDRFDSLSQISHVPAPVLVIAGEHDRIVPAVQSRRLHAAMPRPDARLVVIPAADHNDLELLAGRRLMDEIASFLDSG